MYEFAYYFVYRLLTRYKDETVFTATLGTSIIIFIHVLSLLILLGHFKLIERLPDLRDNQSLNRPIALLIVLVFIGLVFMYFSKSRVDFIMKKYSTKEHFFSLLNISLFLAMIAIPVTVIAYFK